MPEAPIRQGKERPGRSQFTLRGTSDVLQTQCSRNAEDEGTAGTEACAGGNNVHRFPIGILLIPKALRQTNFGIFEQKNLYSGSVEVDLGLEIGPASGYFDYCTQAEAVVFDALTGSQVKD